MNKIIVHYNGNVVTCIGTWVEGSTCTITGYWADGEELCEPYTSNAKDWAEVVRTIINNPVLADCIILELRTYEGQDSDTRTEEPHRQLELFPITQTEQIRPIREPAIYG